MILDGHVTDPLQARSGFGSAAIRGGCRAAPDQQLPRLHNSACTLASGRGSDGGSPASGPNQPQPHISVGAGYRSKRNHIGQARGAQSRAGSAGPDGNGGSRGNAASANRGGSNDSGRRGRTGGLRGSGDLGRSYARGRRGGRPQPFPGFSDSAGCRSTGTPSGSLSR